MGLADVGAGDDVEAEREFCILSGIVDTNTRRGDDFIFAVFFSIICDIKFFTGQQQAVVFCVNPQCF